MSNPNDKTFHCELIDPEGKLLDCEAVSVILPAHDGQLGILHNHMPMLCQLGLGVMKVTPASADSARPSETSDLLFFIDGGSALVAENEVSVIAYEALALQNLAATHLETLIARAAQNAGDQALPPAQRAHEDQRLRALRRLGESPTG